ncbi:hypothetical protein AO262_14480 [Pseudomonas fluorescens ABAC62]|nr:hypothetical protein AO262_14480 [Pseudomonas fluorescens ABAC62]
MNPNSTAAGALFLADNLALDFINSEYGVGDQRHDCFVDDHSVMSWLMQAGLLPEKADVQAPSGLLALARTLRERSRAVVDAAMTGVPVDTAVINQILEAGRPVNRLEWAQETKSFRVTTHPRDSSPASLLGPVVESLVGRPAATG